MGCRKASALTMLQLEEGGGELLRSRLPSPDPDLTSILLQGMLFYQFCLLDYGKENISMRTRCLCVNPNLSRSKLEKALRAPHGLIPRSFATYSSTFKSRRSR